MTSVFLVDDHSVFRAGVKAELAGAVDIVGEAGTVAEAVRGIERTRPDVVLLDVHMPDGGGLAVLKRAPGPVQLRLVLTPRNIGMRQSGNVIAEVPGSDRAAPPVVVACHLDSWDLGTGAIDDAAGCAIVAAAAKRILDAGRPLRTIRIVWFGAEEVGLFGGIAYRARHASEPYYAVAESDFGADRIWKVDSRLGEARKSEALAIQRALQPLGIVPGALDQTGGSDIGPMVADGLPGVALNQDGTRYFDVHHSPDDTLDKVDPAQLRQKDRDGRWTLKRGGEGQ